MVFLHLKSPTDERKTSIYPSAHRSFCDFLPGKARDRRDIGRKQTILRSGKPAVFNGDSRSSRWLLWGAVGKRYRNYGVGGSIAAVVLAVVVSQILIFAGTAFSYLAGIQTLFNYPEALNQSAAVPFGMAMALRTGSFIANCVIGAIAGAIGWALGGLVPAAKH